MKLLSARKDYTIDILLKDGSISQLGCKARSADEAIEQTKIKLGKKLPQVKQLKTRYSDSDGVSGVKSVTFHAAQNVQNMPRSA